MANKRRSPTSRTTPAKAADAIAGEVVAKQLPAADAPGGVARVTWDLHRLLVDSVRDYAIFALDPHGFILTWNAGAERIKGYTADEIIGKHFSIFYPPEVAAEGYPEFELRTAANVGRFEDEGWRVRKDGSRFWANVVITALRDEAGELVGFAKVTRDLTERRAAEQRALEAARRAAVADEANRAKGQFLAAMSHELRTPLNAIGGFTDLLMMGISGPVSPQQLEQLSRIKRAQEHLLSIINDILNFSRIEAGQVTYEPEAVALKDVIEGVIEMISPQAQAKEQTLQNTGCERDVTAWADRAKLGQIVLNLLSNAVKFTPPGGRVSLSCGLHRDDQVAIAVRDTGPGIRREDLEAIFEPFVQVGRTLASRREGTGLGLAISRDLARAMGGDITVESSVDVGSEFCLILPRYRKS